MEAINKKTKLCKKCKKRKRTKYFYIQQQKGTNGNLWRYFDSFCIDCRIEYSSERRREIKRKAIQFLGGKCQDCSIAEDSPEIYDFHHIKGKKEFSIGKQTKAFEAIKDELSKCILLCANCHRKRHRK